MHPIVPKPLPISEKAPKQQGKRKAITLETGEPKSTNNAKPRTAGGKKVSLESRAISAYLTIAVSLRLLQSPQATVEQLVRGQGPPQRLLFKMLPATLQLNCSFLTSRPKVSVT